MKKIAILGVTGSIGDSTIEVVKYHPDKFKIVFASANKDYKKLYNIASELNIQKIAISDTNTILSHTDHNIQLYKGQEELIKLIKNEEYDIIINAVTGSAGLPYTMAILETGNDMALANKESLVMAGELINSEFGIRNSEFPPPNDTPPQKKVSKIIPIDSEHSAIFQILQTQMKGIKSEFQIPNSEFVKSLHITASGGAFRSTPLHELSKVNLKQALKHPTWDMGIKVTIDSATMMNKGLEVIEAHWLFSIDYENIHAVIHPQSVIHSIVEFSDGSMIAQMSVPTMQLPILYALTYPERLHSDKVQTTLTQLPPLTFEPIDPNRYPLYFVARQAALEGGIMPTVLNASNEKAIELFIKGEIGFTDISKYVEKTLNNFQNIKNPDLETILEVNKRIMNLW